MALGLLHGRTDAGEPSPAWDLSRRYRDRFLEVNGFIDCRDQTGGIFNQASHERCTEVVVRALEILLDLLEETRDLRSPWRRPAMRTFAEDEG